MSILIFGVVSLLGLIFISGALVIWLSELTNNMIVALSIVGVMYMIVAASLYVGSIRRILRVWQRRLDTVYDVSAMFEVLYGKAMAYLQKILGGI